ncbi:MAG: HD-GYP domain-containing protein [Acidimicrobiia bacterium]
MAERRLRAISMIAWIALAISAAAFTFAGLTDPGVDTQAWALDALLWTVVITGVTLIAVPAPSGTRLSLGIGAATAASILVAHAGVLGAAISASLVLAWLIQRYGRVGIDRTDGEFLADAIAMGVYAVVFTASLDTIQGWGGFNDANWSIVAAVVMGGIAWFIIRAVVAALVGLERTDLAGRYLWLLSLEDWAVVVSIFAAGTLFGLTWPVMGVWAFAVAVLPYAFGHLAFERYHSTRVTYGQTIRALSQIPEVAGLAPLGHSTRTADLAVSVAQELGLHPNDVVELEYAALMHDVGRITLNEPAILKAGYTDEDIARWGAQIIAEAPYLHQVSSLVEQQHRPYRSPGVEIDPDVPMASKIIKVASAYDQGQIELGLSPVEALERIHQGSAYEFDPVVAASVRRVLVYRGDIPY